MSGLARIANDVSRLGIEIEKGDLVEDDVFRPYHPFCPDQQPGNNSIADFISLSGAPRSSTSRWGRTRRSPA